MLQKDPRIATQLGLSAQLVDGSRNNGEVAEEGLTLNPSAASFDYKIADEQTYRTAPLPSQAMDQLLAGARQLQRDYLATEQGKSVVSRQKVPFALDGGVGSSGVDFAPQLVPAKSDPRDKNRFN